jgi:hypothetical protein
MVKGSKHEEAAAMFDKLVFTKVNLIAKSFQLLPNYIILLDIFTDTILNLLLHNVG